MLARARACLVPCAAAAEPPDEGRGTRSEASDPVLALVQSCGVPEELAPFRLMGRAELAGFFDPLTVALCAQAEACWARGNTLRLMGFVMPAGLPAARALALAGEQLLGVRQDGEFVLLTVPLAAALRRFALRPVVIAALLFRTLFENSHKQLPLALVRGGEIGLGRITG
jgi:hypothetical protein